MEGAVRTVRCALLSVMALLGCVGEPSKMPSNQPVQRTFNRECDLCPQMIRVPGGSFLMWDGAGDTTAPNRKTPVSSQVSSFYIGAFEVTRAEYNACVVAKRCARPDLSRELSTNEVERTRLPVVNVSFEDAQNYVDWLSEHSGKVYRLPTEPEWEFAARAGRTGAYYWGGRPEDACLYANIADLTYRDGNPLHATQFSECRDGHRGLAPVGSLTPNALGVFDILGNAEEYVDAPGISLNSVIVRGGSAHSIAERTTLHRRSSAGMRSGAHLMLGFRIARSE